MKIDKTLTHRISSAINLRIDNSYNLYGNGMSAEVILKHSV